MNKNLTTYRPDKVKVVINGNHIVAGFTEDSFVKVEPNGGGVTMEAGADGEVTRTRSAIKMFKITLSLLYGSSSDNYLLNLWNRDESGDVLFPVMIRDLGGSPLFTGEQCCIENAPSPEYGKTGKGNTYSILVAYGKMEPQ